MRGKNSKKVKKEEQNTKDKRWKKSNSQVSNGFHVSCFWNWEIKTLEFHWIPQHSCSLKEKKRWVSIIYYFINISVKFLENKNETNKNVISIISVKWKGIFSNELPQKHSSKWNNLMFLRVDVSLCTNYNN